MEAVFQDEKVRATARAIAKAIAIVITFALLYYVSVMIAPSLAKSSLAGQAFGKTLRFGTALKAFILITPLSIVGTAAGALAVDLQSGDPIGWVDTSILLANGLFWAWLSHTIGRSRGKDMAILFGFGLTNAALNALKLTAVAMIFHSTAWGNLLEQAVIFKIVTSTLMMMIGYLLVMAWEGNRNARNRITE